MTLDTAAFQRAGLRIQPADFERLVMEAVESALPPRPPSDARDELTEDEQRFLEESGVDLAEFAPRDRGVASPLAQTAADYAALLATALTVPDLASRLGVDDKSDPPATRTTYALRHQGQHVLAHPVVSARRCRPRAGPGPASRRAALGWRASDRGGSLVHAPARRSGRRERAAPLAARLVADRRRCRGCRCPGGGAARGCLSCPCRRPSPTLHASHRRGTSSQPERRCTVSTSVVACIPASGTSSATTARRPHGSITTSALPHMRSRGVLYAADTPGHRWRRFFRRVERSTPIATSPGWLASVWRQTSSCLT